MRLADYIFKFFNDKGVNEIFMVTGGHAMFLNDAAAMVTKAGGYHFTCVHHEQAATMSADAYGRLLRKPAIALVTAGPGSVNAITGVAGGWVDSAPMIILSGQSNYSVIDFQVKHGLRQYGVQGISMKEHVEHFTKMFVTVDDAKKIVKYLHEAWEACTTGRPGPVWIDVPLDMQRTELPDEFLAEEEKKYAAKEHKKVSLKKPVEETFKLLKKSKRPLILAGQGVHLSGAEKEFLELVDKLKMPVVTSRLGLDLIASDHPFYVGRPGTYGDRPGNITVQNSDLIIALGSRLGTAMTGHDPKDFGRSAKKIVVDMDEKELIKPDLNIVLPVHGDVKEFINEFLVQLKNEQIADYKEWADHCRNIRDKYPVTLPQYKDETPVNSYYFTDRLSTIADPNTWILVDTGSCFHVAAQAWKIKTGQRYLTTGGISSMGYWAAGIGACVANNRKSTIIITGDGSFQMNLQELATIRGNKLPVKIFIFNNNGYLLIRHTQRNYFEGRMIGEGPESGVWCPDALELAKVYGFKGVRIENVVEVDSKIKEVLSHDGPVICDVRTPEWQLLIPRVASEKDASGKLIQRKYEDMYPYIDAEELKSILIEE